MKKHLLLSCVALALTAIVFTGCKDDEDTTPPTITLSGPNPDNLEMLTSYVDPGYSASDDEDGNLTANVVVDYSEIDNRLPGSYEVHYELTDNAGNAADVHREVNVYCTPAALAKNYTVKDSCGSGASLLVFNYAQSITVNSSTSIKFSKFADYSGNTNITATVATDGTITIALQQANGIGSLSENHTFQGSGYVTPTGIYITYTDTNLSQGNTSATCKAYFTR